MKNRITKVCTRTGDKGTTSLADGSRINKDNIRIESYGNIDELNSIVGICRQSVRELPSDDIKLLDSWLFAIQNDLFNVGADLAAPVSSRWENMNLVGKEDVIVLEKIIDFCQEFLPPLKEFVLPGGTLLNSYLHLARTVCRRAERTAVSLSKNEEINEFIIPYINRLSDLLFVLSRWVQHKLNMLETTWQREGGVRSVFAVAIDTHKMNI